MVPLGEEKGSYLPPGIIVTQSFPGKKSDQELTPPLGVATSTPSGWPYHLKGQASPGFFIP